MKRLLQQKRGKPASVHRSRNKTNFFLTSAKKIEKGMKIKKIIHAPGQRAPIMELEKKYFLRAIMGARTGGQIFTSKENMQVKEGNLYYFSLSEFKIGDKVCYISPSPTQIGKYCTAPGSYATIHSKTKNNAILLFSSKKERIFDLRCKAFLGRIAGSGKNTLILGKAGLNMFKYKRFAKRNLKVRGVAMNRVSHLHGGGNHQHVGKPNTVSHRAPPGKKVGNLGKLKKKK